MNVPPSRDGTDTVIAALLLCTVAVFVGTLAYTGPVVGDELVHFPQIERFLGGDFAVDRDLLTTIPGFHLLVAAIMSVSGAESLGAARLANASLGVLAIVAFRWLRARSGGASDGLASMQFAALPILLPFFFLVYTDVLSLALVLAAVAATLSRTHLLSAALLVLAMLVRQNNVIWLGLLVPLALLQSNPASARPALSTLVRDGSPYLACVAAFCAFWLWNGSISLSPAQATAHPDMRIGIGNVVFTLFLAGVLLPFHVAHGLARFAVKVRAMRWIAAVPLLLSGVFFLGFEVDHPYNLIDPKWSWRNRILQAAQAHWHIDAIIGIVAAAAACGLGSFSLRPKNAWWIYPAMFLFLSTSWLIETRYALIPIALWLAFREPLDRRAELATFILWLVAAAWLFHGVMHGEPFL